MWGGNNVPEGWKQRNSARNNSVKRRRQEGVCGNVRRSYECVGNVCGVARQPVLREGHPGRWGVGVGGAAGRCVQQAQCGKQRQTPAKAGVRSNNRNVNTAYTV